MIIYALPTDIAKINYPHFVVCLLRGYAFDYDTEGRDMNTINPDYTGTDYTTALNRIDELMTAKIRVNTIDLCNHGFRGRK